MPWHEKEAAEENKTLLYAYKNTHSSTLGCLCSWLCSSASLCVYFYRCRLCLCVYLYRLSGCAISTGPSKLEFTSWLKALYLEKPVWLVFYLHLTSSVPPPFYLHLHHRADIMRTWVSNERKCHLSAFFLGHLLKTTGFLIWAINSEESLQSPALTEQTVQRDANVQPSVISLWWDGLKCVHGWEQVESQDGSLRNLASQRIRWQDYFYFSWWGAGKKSVLMTSSVSSRKCFHFIYWKIIIRANEHF